MAAIIDAVQNGIWQAGVHDLLGYRHGLRLWTATRPADSCAEEQYRSADVRLHWDTVMGDTVADRELVYQSIRNAIGQLR